MPNWCSNEFIVSGAPDAVRAFIDKATGGVDGEFQLERLIPMPKSLSDDDLPIVGGLQIYGELAAEIYSSARPIDFGGKALANLLPGQPPPRSRAEAMDAVDHVALRQNVDSDAFRVLGARWAHNVETHGVGWWLPWRMSHWGIKWDVDGSVEYEEGDDYARVCFDSPWGPPEAAFARLVSDHPELEFTGFFEESGNAIYGRWNSGCEPLEPGEMRRVEIESLDLEEVRLLKNWPWPTDDEYDDDEEEDDDPMSTSQTNPATTTRMGP